MKNRIKLFVLAGVVAVVAGGIFYTAFQKHDSLSYKRDSGLSARVSEPGQITKPEKEKSLAESMPGIEDVSRDLMVGYVRSLGLTGGEELSEKQQADLKEVVLENYTKNWKEGLVRYSANDFKLGKSDPEDIHRYGNSLGKSILDNTPENMPVEINSIKGVLEDNDQSSTEGLGLIVEGYAGLVKDAKEMHVPGKLGEVHAKLVTGMERHLINISSIYKISEDPIRGLVGFSDYQSGVENMYQAFQDLSREFHSDGVSFSEDESGSAIADTL